MRARVKKLFAGIMLPFAFNLALKGTGKSETSAVRRENAAMHQAHVQPERKIKWQYHIPQKVKIAPYIRESWMRINSSGQISGAVKFYSEKSGFDQRLIESIIISESEARQGKKYGLMGVFPEGLAELQKHGTAIKNVRGPDGNIHAGCELLNIYRGTLSEKLGARFDVLPADVKNACLYDSYRYGITKYLNMMRNRKEIKPLSKKFLRIFAQVNALHAEK